jgi:hypothetical protein
MRSLIVLAVAVAAALGSAVALPAQSGQAAVARDAAVPFKVGERLTYDVTWSTFLVAGTASAAVAERRSGDGGSATYYLGADGRLLPQRTSLYSEQSGAKRLAATRFARPERKAFFELDDAGTPLKSEFDVPPQVQDGLSAVYVLRAMNFTAGERITLPIADDGSMYSVHADPVAREQVRVPLGAMESWRVNVTILDAAGQPAATDAAVWYSTDARRLPLKLQARLPVGHFVLLLREAR